MARSKSAASLRGTLGALSLHATHDPRQPTRAARAAFEARWAREVDPDGVLPEPERERRIAYARRAYFVRLALLRRGGRKPGRSR
jgi:hypothetical protein